MERAEAKRKRSIINRSFRMQMCNVKTADYIWNGKYWDLKSTSTEKSANSAIRHGLQQIKENPGGIILNYRDNKIAIDEVIKNV